MGRGRVSLYLGFVGTLSLTLSLTVRGDIHAPRLGGEAFTAPRAVSSESGQKLVGSSCPTGLPYDPNYHDELPHDFVNAQDSNTYIRPIKDPAREIKPGCMLVKSSAIRDTSFLKAVNGNSHALLVGEVIVNGRPTKYLLQSPGGYSTDFSSIDSSYHVLCPRQYPPGVNKARDLANLPSGQLQEWKEKLRKYSEFVNGKYFFTLWKDIYDNSPVGTRDKVGVTPKNFSFDGMYQYDLDGTTEKFNRYYNDFNNGKVPNGLKLYCAEAAFMGSHLAGEAPPTGGGLIRALANLPTENDAANIVDSQTVTASPEQKAQVKEMGRLLWRILHNEDQAQRLQVMNTLVGGANVAALKATPVEQLVGLGETLIDTLDLFPAPKQDEIFSALLKISKVTEPQLSLLKNGWNGVFGRLGIRNLDTAARKQAIATLIRSSPQFAATTPTAATTGVLNSMRSGIDNLNHLWNIVSPNDLVLTAASENSLFSYVGTVLDRNCRVEGRPNTNTEPPALASNAPEGIFARPRTNNDDNATTAPVPANSPAVAERPIRNTFASMIAGISVGLTPGYPTIPVAGGEAQEAPASPIIGQTQNVPQTASNSSTSADTDGFLSLPRENNSQGTGTSSALVAQQNVGSSPIAGGNATQTNSEVATSSPIANPSTQNTVASAPAVAAPAPVQQPQYFLYYSPTYGYYYAQEAVLYQRSDGYQYWGHPGQTYYASQLNGYTQPPASNYQQTSSYTYQPNTQYNYGGYSSYSYPSYSTYSNTAYTYTQPTSYYSYARYY